MEELTQKLGRPEKRYYWAICAVDHEKWHYSLKGGAESLDVTITMGLIDEIDLSGRPGVGKDSFGVFIGDAKSTLYTRRGEPKETYTYQPGLTSVVYPISNRVAEEYKLQNGRISHIDLNWDTLP